jgi:hypothetical protein
MALSVGSPTFQSYSEILNGLCLHKDIAGEDLRENERRRDAVQPNEIPGEGFALAALEIDGCNESH